MRAYLAIPTDAVAGAVPLAQLCYFAALQRAANTALYLIARSTPCLSSSVCRGHAR
jgi:hypothetical protein